MEGLSSVVGGVPHRCCSSTVPLYTWPFLLFPCVFPFLSLLVLMRFCRTLNATAKPSDAVFCVYFVWNLVMARRVKKHCDVRYFVMCHLLVTAVVLDQVSCIYGLGMPSKYLEASTRLVVGQEWAGGWITLAQHLEQVSYHRN